MDTMSGYENGYALPAQTAAARTLQALGRHGAQLIQVTDGPNRLQTYMDFGSEAIAEHPVELYDYVSDGVVFEETLAEAVGPVVKQSEQAEQNPTLFFGRGARLPKFRLDLQKDGKDFDMTIRISGQNPNETAREGAIATKEAGEALYETLYVIVQEEIEAFRGREGSSDKAAVVAITYTCAEKILDYSHHNDMASDGKLETVIRQECPNLLQDKVFERVLRHFNADPEGFREKFIQGSGSALTQIVRAHPARTAFLTEYGLETEAPEDGHDQ